MTRRPPWPRSADPHPLVRRNVIKAGESLLKAAPKFAAAVLRAVDDPDARVRLQLALSLGNWTDTRAGSALARILRRDPYDPWIPAAVLSSALPNVTPLLVELFRPGGEPPPLAVVEPLVVLAGSSCDRPAIDSLIGAIGTPAGKGGLTPPWQYAALRGLLDGSARSRQPIDLARERRLNGLLDAARRLARDDSASQADRILAVDLLEFSAASLDEDCTCWPICSRLGFPSPFRVRPSPRWAPGDSAGARTIARGLENLLACPPRPDHRHPAQSEGLGFVAARGDRGRASRAGRDRSGPAQQAAGESRPGNAAAGSDRLLPRWSNRVRRWSMTTCPRWL